MVAYGQSSNQLPQNPREVFQRERVGALLAFVERYFQYETQGERLSDEGWQVMAPFFLHPIPAPRERKIIVIGGYGVGGGNGPVIRWTPSPTPDRRATAEVEVSTNEAVGTIDSSLHFFPATVYGYTIVNDLVLTDKRPAWKFTKESPAVYIGVPTAILYVTVMREKTTDRTVRKNADTTLAALKKIPAY